MTQSQQLHMTVYASLFAALIAAGAYLAIPVGPVPSRWGLAAVGVYLLAGALGLPVFAGGAGGIGRILGPTGGYLIGYLPVVFLIGFVAERSKGRIPFDVLAMICGTAVLYACGVSWLKVVTGMEWSKAAAAGMVPFLPGDVLKIIAAVPIAKTLRPVIQGKFQDTGADAYSRG